MRRKAALTSLLNPEVLAHKNIPSVIPHSHASSNHTNIQLLQANVAGRGADEEPGVPNRVGVAGVPLRTEGGGVTVAAVECKRLAEVTMGWACCCNLVTCAPPAPGIGEETM